MTCCQWQRVHRRAAGGAQQTELPANRDDDSWQMIGLFGHRLGPVNGILRHKK